MDDLNTQINDQQKRSFPLIKVIFVGLGLILLAEVVYAVWVLKSSVPASPAPPVTQTITSSLPTISLNAAKVNFAVNETVAVAVLIDSGNKNLTGVDLIVKFDPKVLEATPGGLIKGKILDEYPLMTVDQNKGIISISGVSNTENGFKGTGLFATINFKAKTPGQTLVTIDFQKGLSTDSNLVETSTSGDILEQVNNLELEIK